MPDVCIPTTLIITNFGSFSIFLSLFLPWTTSWITFFILFYENLKRQLWEIEFVWDEMYGYADEDEEEEERKRKNKKKKKPQVYKV